MAGEAKPLLPTEETFQQREARLQWWREARFGMFIHWGPASVSGKEISWSRVGHPHDHPGNESVPAAIYDRLYQQFNPIKFDADAWMRLAKSAGMRYVVFITKHHDGFSMWPTGLRRDYSIAATPFKRDICAEIAEAAHRNGLKLGWYYSTRDWTHPDYLVGDNRKYDEFYRGQVRELLSNYGRVDMLWFDHVAGNWRDYQFEKLFDVLYRLQPGILVNDRAARFIRPTRDRPSEHVARLTQGDFDTPEQRIGKFQNDRPWESCMTMTRCPDGGGWSYRPDGRTSSFDDCLQMLVSTVTGDGNLLLNIGPLPTGEIASDQQAILREMGRWLARFGESIYGTRGGPFANGAWGGSTYRDRTVYLHVFRGHGPLVHLPRLKAGIARVTALTGGVAQVVSSTEGMDVVLPPESAGAVDAVIKLELDGPAEKEFAAGKPLAITVPAPVTLASPSEYQVFQRKTKTQGTIDVQGPVPEGCDRLEVCVDSGWHPVALKPGQKTFRTELSVPAGGWYPFQVRAWGGGSLRAAQAVPHVGVGEVFVIAGQSNSCSFGSERQRTASGRVAAFDGTKWQLANDPQPGAEGAGGSFMPAFGDLLQERFDVPIGIVAVGAGGTSVREWLPKGDRMDRLPTTGSHVRAVGPGEWESTGELFDRLTSRLRALGPHGYRAILWHQGESDAGQARADRRNADRQISGSQYQAYLKRLIEASRAACGWPVPWFVAQATYHSEQDPADQEFRDAQAAVCRNGLANPGPDTDALRAEYRDGVHFNARGLRRHGELWAQRVGNWLGPQIDVPSGGTPH